MDCSNACIHGRSLSRVQHSELARPYRRMLRPRRDRPRSRAAEKRDELAASEPRWRAVCRTLSLPAEGQPAPAVKKEGVADADIELMLRKNPARLLGLEG